MDEQQSNERKGSGGVDLYVRIDAVDYSTDDCLMER